MNTVNVGRYHTEDEGESDIDAGKKWSREIDQQLDATKIGVLGLTRQNLAQPWILFEAGALAKQVESDTSRVTPYLFDVSPTELVVPLSSFQAATAVSSHELGTPV